MPRLLVSHPSICDGIYRLEEATYLMEGRESMSDQERLSQSCVHDRADWLGCSEKSCSGNRPKRSSRPPNCLTKSSYDKKFLLLDLDEDRKKSDFRLTLSLPRWMKRPYSP